MAKMSVNKPGSFKGNMEASRASEKAKSKLPGAGFISMEAGANPDMKAAHDNGPRGDEAHMQIESGSGSDKPMRTKTGRDQSPYSVS